MPNEMDPSDPSAAEDQCLLYLFGELDAEQHSDFERRLASDAQLAGLLEQCSMSISEVAAALRSEPVCDGVSRVSASGSDRWFRYAGLLAATAASIGLAVVAVRWQSRSETHATLIAQTWADQQSVTADLISFAPWSDSDAIDDDFEVERAESDETLDWMYSAIITDRPAESIVDPIDAIDSGDANDG